MQSETIDKLAAAMAKAQGDIGGAAKKSENPHFRSKYADLASVVDAIREPFAKNGLSYYQPYRAVDGELRIVTRITHTSGEWIEDDGVPLLLAKQDMQGLGSASTYARRYGLMAAAGVAPEDDDGNAAVGDNRDEGKPVTVKRGTAKNPDEKPDAGSAVKIEVPEAPGMIPVPSPQRAGVTMTQIWKAWAAALVHQCDIAPDVATINAWADANQPPLDNLKIASTAAYDHVIQQIELKRGVLAQAPSEAEE